jgi:hypothetical protein
MWLVMAPSAQRPHPEMVMSAKEIGFLVLLLASFAPASARAQLPPVPEGYDLPSPTTEYDVNIVIQAMIRSNCQTPQCIGLKEALVLYNITDHGRYMHGTTWIDGKAPDTNFFAEKSAEIDAEARKFRKFWPEICDAVTAIGARDDFKSDQWSSMAAWSLDIARHLTRPGLDCLDKVKDAMPRSKHRDESVDEAFQYCAGEGGNIARCARLKR